MNSILNLPTGRPIFFSLVGKGGGGVGGNSNASYSMLSSHPAPFLIIILLLGCVSSYHLLFHENEVRCTSQTHQ